MVLHQPTQHKGREETFSPFSRFLLDRENGIGLEVPRGRYNERLRFPRKEKKLKT
jgi:hypothetical protein